MPKSTQSSTSLSKDGAGSRPRPALTEPTAGPYGSRRLHHRPMAGKQHGPGRARGARAQARLGDVARAARVSTATVSRVINETGYVSEDSRARVLRAVQ